MLSIFWKGIAQIMLHKVYSFALINSMYEVLNFAFAFVS